MIKRNERRVGNVIVGWIIPFCWHKRGVNNLNAESCTHLEINELKTRGLQYSCSWYVAESRKYDVVEIMSRYVDAAKINTNYTQLMIRDKHCRNTLISLTIYYDYDMDSSSWHLCFLFLARSWSAAFVS